MNCFKCGKTLGNSAICSCGYDFRKRNGWFVSLFPAKAVPSVWDYAATNGSGIKDDLRKPGYSESFFAISAAERDKEVKQNSPGSTDPLFDDPEDKAQRYFESFFRNPAAVGDKEVKQNSPGSTDPFFDDPEDEAQRYFESFFRNL